MKRIFTLISCAVLSTAAMIAQVPFKVTTIENGEFAAGTTWYTMGIGEGAKLIKDNAGADYIALGVSTPKGNDDELWCFVGNDTDGYAIYNKQAGVDKVLASKTTMSAISGYGGTGGSTYPIMQDAANLPSGYVGRWDFASSNKIANVNGYFMRIHGTNYAVNDFGGRGMLAFWAEGADAGSTIVITAAETSVEILVSEGAFTASNANGTWHSKWESSELAGFSLSANANNMTTSGDYIAGYSGQSGSCSYTLTAPEGLVVKGYSFDYVNTNNDGSYALTLTAEGKNYTSSATTQHIDVEVAEPARTVYFTQSGANKGITYSNFVVHMGLDIRTPEPAFDVFPTLTSSAIPYRIPAIATAKNGNIIAVADYRHSRADIGMATNGRIDLRARISTDNGETWGEIFDIIQGKGAAGIDASNNDMYVGFGDPAIVADRESNRVLVISCSGNVSFPNGQRNNHQGIAHFYSEDCGVNWSTPVDRAEHIYAQFDNTQHGPVRAMFVGSGKISQSQYIKVGEYYRIYCAVLVKNVDGAHVNFVLYSDNFGESWTVLGGGEVSPIPSGGDEPKADELPDGSVIISSRTTGGRIYNIFSYTDSEKAEGSWGTAKYSNSSNNGTIAVNNSTNGEIMFVPAKRKADDKKVYLALQSVPLGSGRANVGIYYKELETLEDFITPEAIAADWDGRHQSSYVGGAYSTMTLQHDNNIGFLYEEDTYGTNGGGYTIVYKNYSIEYITDSAYVYDADVDKTAIVAAGIDAKIAGFDPDAPTYVGSVDGNSLNAVAELIEAYKNEPSYEAYEAINAGIANMPRLEVEAGKWYRIRNSARSNATLYLNPEASRVSTATSNVSNANQLFTFLPTGNDKEFYLYNGNYQYMLGPLGNNETQPIVTTDNAAAGKWKIESTTTGLSSIICQNKTGGNTGLHLAGDGVRLVPWTNNAEASLWYIEPVEEFALTIDEYAAVCMPFAMTLPQGVAAYTAGAPQTADGVDFVMLTECGTNIIPANTPVILAATSGTYNIGVGGEATALEGKSQLHGVLKSVSVDGSNIYTLSNGQLVKRTATSGNIAANTAYYVADNSAETLVLKNIFEATYTLVDQAGNEFNGSFTYDGNNTPVVTGAFGATITDAEMDFANKHYTATINFAYPMSKVGGDTNETLLAINGKYIRAVGNNVKVQTTNVAAVDANCLWAIYPSFNEGAFTFAIMNVATGKYMHTDATGAVHDTEGTVVLSDEATMFTIADNNEFKTGNGLYLSINSPAYDTNVFLGVWSNAHGGTDIIDSALSAYNVEVTAAKYATFYAPVAVTVPESVTAYTVTINDGGWADLNEIEGGVIPAYTGVVLYSETPATYTFNVTTTDAVAEENALTGTVAATYVTADAYVLGFQDGETGFYTAAMTDGAWLNNHHKAYLPKVQGMNAASYSFRFPGTTGIEEVKVENGNVKGIYDLQGRKVTKPIKGIYIIDGKKVFVK